VVKWLPYHEDKQQDNECMMNTAMMDTTLSRIEELTQNISAAPKSVALYKQRAELYYSLHQAYLDRPAPFHFAPDDAEKRQACRTAIAYLQKAIHDYNVAIQLTDMAKTDIDGKEYRSLFIAYMLCGAFYQGLHEYSQALAVTR
jgi:hypothetical protein